MAGRTFKGGIHPPYNKELTAHKAIEAGPDPAEIVIPLSQHIGAPCEPLVAKGDEVKAGQKIGEARGFISAPVHSSVAGKVRAVEFRPHSSGSPALSVVIRAAATEATEAVKVERTGDTVEALREAAREAGLVGLGGAAFPTHVKLTPPEGKTVDTVLINGCECEPYLTCDHRQMLEQAEQMLDGLELISKMVGAKTGYIGIEDNKKDAIKHLKQLTKGMSNVTVVRLATKYPQGFEKKLIEAVLGRVVPLGGLPSDIGVVVQNSGTAIALSEAVRDGKPLIERVVTVTGRGVAEPKNLRVKIGTPAQALVDFCGGAEGETGKIVFGGPMTGAVQTGLEAPVVKGTSGILLLSPFEVGKEKAIEPCIRCGECVEACPMGLLPYQLGNYGELERWDDAEEYSAMGCCDCGCCSYVCPASRPLAQWIKLAKFKIQQKQRTA